VADGLINGSPTGDNSAVASNDYQATSGTLTFEPGETSEIVRVLVNGDRVPEPNETFVVNLSGATNAVITGGQGVDTIVDDEPHISISDVSKKEGRKNQTTLFTFTVTLSAACDQAVTISFRTVDGSATTGDSDYIAKTGMLNFAPGESTKTITIDVRGDSKREANETFYLDLFGNSGNSMFSKNRGTGTILNDD
jgi:Calx-beta domain-containing protein